MLLLCAQYSDRLCFNFDHSFIYCDKVSNITKHSDLALTAKYIKCVLRNMITSRNITLTFKAQIYICVTLS